MKFKNVKIKYRNGSNFVGNKTAKNLNILKTRLDNDENIEKYSIYNDLDAKNGNIPNKVDVIDINNPNNFDPIFDEIKEDSKEGRRGQNGDGNDPDAQNNSQGENPINKRPTFLKNNENFSDEVKEFSEKIKNKETVSAPLDANEFIEVQPPKNPNQKPDSKLFSYLLPNLLTVLLTIINKWKPIFSSVKFDKSEKKEISEAFSDAYPDLEINPKISFFATILLIVGSKINIKKLADDEK